MSNIFKKIVDKVRGQAGQAEGSLRDKLQTHYAELTATRDAVNEVIAPLRAQIEALNQEIVVRQDQVRVLTAKVNEARGSGEEWLQLKAEIGVIASALNKLK